jgi:hypothetical protein
VPSSICHGVPAGFKTYLYSLQSERIAHD